jgi:hypothetical protein
VRVGGKAGGRGGRFVGFDGVRSGFRLLAWSSLCISSPALAVSADRPRLPALPPSALPPSRPTATARLRTHYRRPYHGPRRRGLGTLRP